METVEVMIATKWHLIQALSEIGFRVKSLVLSDVRGIFKDYNASFYITGADLTTAEIDLCINPASVETVDTNLFRLISFTGNTIERVSTNHYAVYGDLTIKGISKRIRFEVEIIKTSGSSCRRNGLGFYVTGTISRRDFGLTGNALLNSNGIMLSDEVYIDCEIELAKKIH